MENLKFVVTTAQNWLPRHTLVSLALDLMRVSFWGIGQGGQGKTRRTRRTGKTREGRIINIPDLIDAA